MNFEIVPQDDVWVRQAKKNLTAFYENRPMDRMPFEFYDFDVTDEYKPKVESTPTTPSRTIAENRRTFLDEELNLKTQLETIAARVRKGFRDDTVLALHPIGGACEWLAEALGCEMVWFANRPPHPHPMITEVSQIDSLRLPDFKRGELYQVLIRQMRFFRKVVGDRIPVAAPALESPIDTASVIFDYTKLIYAMVDDPRRVHAMMRIITDATIQGCRAILKETTDYPLSGFNWWLPRGCGCPKTCRPC